MARLADPALRDQAETEFNWRRQPNVLQQLFSAPPGAAAPAQPPAGAAVRPAAPMAPVPVPAAAQPAPGDEDGDRLGLLFQRALSVVRPRVVVG